jgi:manganese-dependent inorganic pyrophosphatase
VGNTDASRKRGRFDSAALQFVRSAGCDAAPKCVTFGTEAGHYQAAGNDRHQHSYREEAMNDIFITGHRNPDMDSVCASWAYAQLKTTLDPHTRYHAIRCGHMNAQTKATLKEIGITPPRLEKDVHPRVRDIVTRNPHRISANEPTLNAVKIIHDYNISIMPVFENDSKFVGLVSVNEISDFLISEHIGGRPRYFFCTDNFEEILSGFCYRQGTQHEFTAPVMIGAMPYETSLDRIRALLPDKPILVVGQREKILEYAIEQQFPAIVLTGVREPDEVSIDFSSYSGTVFVSRTDTAETVRLLRLSSPVKNIMATEYPLLTEDRHFDEAKNLLVNSDLRGLPVFSADDESQFVGVVTRRCFIDRPSHKVIMVDHNEADQSIRGIENAEILEIIDHHRLAAEKTRTPIYIAAKPVGSTCTIVYQHYLQAGVPVNATTAKVLLAGLLSDTVILKSPTATNEDRRAAAQLANVAGITIEEFGEHIFSHTAVLGKESPQEVIKADFKRYSEFSLKIGIGQVEVVTFQNIDEVEQTYLDALEEVKKDQKLDWTMLLITNVLHEHSKLFTTPFPEAEERLVFKQEKPGRFDLPNILSRKKQVLPEILRVLEELGGNNK